MPDDVTATVEPDEIVTKQVNAAGMIYLGRDLSDKHVRVAYEVVDE